MHLSSGDLRDGGQLSKKIDEDLIGENILERLLFPKELAEHPDSTVFWREKIDPLYLVFMKMTVNLYTKVKNT